MVFFARSQSRNSSIPDRPGWTASPGHARFALGLILLLGLPGGAQNGSTQVSPPLIGLQRNPMGVDDNESSPDEERRLRALNAERQKSLVADTNKLLKLAHELNDEIASSQSESPSQAEFTKVAEIEKLAHRVKDKMSTSVRGTTDLQPFPISAPR